MQQAEKLEPLECKNCKMQEYAIHASAPFGSNFEKALITLVITKHLFIRNPMFEVRII
jgi:hypothetical protein